MDILKEAHALLKKGGKLFLTTPIPCMDWFMKLLEAVGLNQKRTSPHSNLTWLKDDTLFADKKIKYKCLLSQWAIFTK